MHRKLALTVVVYKTHDTDRHLLHAIASNCDFYTLQVTEVSVKSNTLQLRNSVYSE